jgi:hypothetical protein
VDGPSPPTLQNTTLRAELGALAKQQERLADAADHARDEAERARGAAKVGGWTRCMQNYP